MARRFFLLIPLVILLTLAQPALAAGPYFSAEIDPRVLEDLASGSAHLIVRLKDPPATPAALTTSDLVNDRVANRVTRLRQAAGSAQAGLLGELRAQGLPFRSYWIVNAIAVEAGPALLARLAAHPDVLSIESDRSFRAALETLPTTTTTTADVGLQPGLSLVKAPSVWAFGVRGQGMVVASADTGVEWQHPALLAKYRGWNGSAADHNTNWWDAIHGPVEPGSTFNPCGYTSSVPCDDFGHGTHTTGTMTGSTGSANQIGMAPDAKWIACRNMDHGWGKPSTYIECLQFFIAPTDLAGNHPDPSRRPHVIDNSYNCPALEGCQSDSLHAAVQEVRSAGIFMAVSAGNDGNDLNNGSSCSTIAFPPANEAGVFTVGGVQPGANPQDIAVYTRSSRGPVINNGPSFLKPDLAAPAYGITSSVQGGGYGSMNGTSMAAPHVAGAVALLWSAVPSLQRQVSETEALLRQSAVPLPVNETCGGLPAGAVPNNTTGWGLLNVYAAYLEMNPNQILMYFPVVGH